MEATGSRVRISSFADNPKAVCTFATASAAVTEVSAAIISETIVVRGVTEEEPAGAFNVAVKAFPVSTFTPPYATIANGAPVLSKSTEPVASDVPFCSPVSQTPLLLRSANTVAPDMYPSIILKDSFPEEPLPEEPLPLDDDPPPPPPQAAKGSKRSAYLAPLSFPFFSDHSDRNF